MKYCIVVFLFSLTLMSCASKPSLVASYPLLKETVRAHDGAFTGNIPKGWYSAAGDTLPPGAAAWLMREDLSAVLILKELHLDRVSAQRVREKGLKFLAQLSLGFRGDGIHSLKNTTKFSDFKIKEKKFCEYQLHNGGEWRSVVVFSMKGRYYECEAFSKEYSEAEKHHVLAAQHAFLSTVN